jgi:hypothetical protein
MLKKIGLSTAALLAAMAFVQAPSALAAGRDDFRARNNTPTYNSGYRDDVRDYRTADCDDNRYVPQTRNSRFRGRFEYNAPESRGQQSRGFHDRDDHDFRR